MLDVALALRLGCVEERIDRGDRVIVGDVALALEDGVDQRLAVDAECDGLTNLHIGEVAFAAVHPDLAVGGTTNGVDGEVAVVEDGVAADHGELRDRVGRATLQTRDQRCEVLAEGVLQLVEERLAAPPIRVGLERCAGRLVVGGHLEGAGTRHALIERGAEREVLRRDDRLRVVRTDLLRELAIGVEKGDLDGEVVDRLGGAGGDGRLQVAAGQAVHRGDDVGGGERRSVVPLHALAEHEGPHAAVGVRLPRLGECRRDVATDGIDEIVEAGRDRAVGAEVGHGDRVERTGGCLRNDAQRATLLDRAACCGAACRRGACGCRGATSSGGAGRRRGAAAARTAVASTCGDDSTDHRRAETDHHSPLNECTPRESTAGVRLHELYLYWAGLATNTVKKPVVHQSLPVMQGHCEGGPVATR